MSWLEEVGSRPGRRDERPVSRQFAEDAVFVARDPDTGRFARGEDGWVTAYAEFAALSAGGDDEVEHAQLRGQQLLTLLETGTGVRFCPPGAGVLEAVTIRWPKIEPVELEDEQ